MSIFILTIEFYLLYYNNKSVFFFKKINIGFVYNPEFKLLTRRGYKMLRKYLGSVPYRIFCAVNGITATFKSELAFKMEVLGIPVVIAVLYFCPWPLWKKIMQFCAYLWILHSELTNSAIEKVNDAFSKKEWHEMSKREKKRAFNPLIKKSKDMASSAVLIAIIVNALIFIAFCDSEGMFEFLRGLLTPFNEQKTIGSLRGVNCFN